MTAPPSIPSSIAGILLGFAVLATPASAQTRGELLYSTHCNACHTAQMHWRDSRAVTDWKGLRAEVRKWQIAANLAWSEDDILDVSRYLNDSIYHFADTASKAPAPSPGGRSVDAVAQNRRPFVPDTVTPP